MISKTIITYILSACAAAIPIAIWLYILFKKEKKEKSLLFWTFIGGTMAVIPLIGLQYFWEAFPKFDIFNFLTANIEDQKMTYLATFMVVGIMEEIAKQIYVRFLDTKKVVIRSINDSIRFSLVAALGFAFAENIFYYYNIYTNFALRDLLVSYIFRSTFTAAGHMCFSGIFGYFYGRARFSSTIRKVSKWQGEKFPLVTLMARITGKTESESLQTRYILQGLFLSIILHATFNFILQIQQVYIVMIYIGLTFTYLLYLLKRESGELELLNDVSERIESTIDTKTEHVLIELMGIWLNKKRYEDVIEIGKRLLAKDPSNNVIKLLQAKAIEAVEGKDNILNQTIGSITTIKKFKEKDKSVIKKYIEEKQKNRIEKKQDKDTPPPITEKKIIYTNDKEDYFHID